MLYYLFPSLSVSFRGQSLPSSFHPQFSSNVPNHLFLRLVEPLPGRVGLPVPQQGFHALPAVWILHGLARCDSSQRRNLRVHSCLSFRCRKGKVRFDRSLPKPLLARSQENQGIQFFHGKHGKIAPAHHVPLSLKVIRMILSNICQSGITYSLFSGKGRRSLVSQQSKLLEIL